MELTNNNINPSMLFLEVPLFQNDVLLQKQHEVMVNEGESNIKAADSNNFDDFGGGVDLLLPNSSNKRTVHWKTRGNVLELVETSLQVNLIQNHVLIHFQNSKVLPGVNIFQVNKQVIILFATIHAAHRIVINVSQLKKQQSILSNFKESYLKDPKHNFYFTQVEQVTCFSSFIMKKKHSNTAIFSFGIDTGNVVVLKMPMKGQPVLSKLNQASRISRIWSGINPWSTGYEGDIPCDVTIFDIYDPKAVTICRDNKVRLWSLQNNECLNQFDLNQFVGEEWTGQIGKCHKLRSVSSEDNSYHLITIYLTFDDMSMFISFQYKEEDQSFSHLSSIKCELEDVELSTKLLDYQILSSYLVWAMWQDSQEDVILSVCDLKEKVWHDVALATSPFLEVVVPVHLTVQETYLGYLFMSGTFSAVAIGKALSIHQRNLFTSRNLSWRSLRESVIKVVQNEIQNQLPEDGSATLNDTIDIQLSTWQSFYQTCLQYQKFVSKPLGITKPTADGFVVVKKEFTSHLVAVSSLEAMCRGANPSQCNTALFNEPNVDELGKLLSCLSLLSSTLGQDYIDTLLFSLSGNENPIDLIKNEMDIIKELINERLDRTELYQSLREVGDINQAVNMLLICLDPGTFDGNFISSASQQLTGDCGIEILCGAVKRYISDRLQLSLLLLIVTIYFDQLQNTAPPRVAIYVQAYSAIKWTVTATVEHISQSSLESTLQSLSVRDSHQHVPTTLIEYFLRNEGGCLLQQLLDLPGTVSHEMMPRAAAAVVQLLWPLGLTMSFPDFLLAKGQFSSLQHYLEQELHPWCDFSPSYCLYLLGLCQLHTGQYNKSVETFLQGAGKLTNEEDHLYKILCLEESEDIELVESAYYTKALQIFEKLDLAEQVILIATYAIEKVAADDRSLPTLCSSVFRQSLALRRHDDAYKAIVSNPDPDHQKDCLRTMVVALCERREYKTLVEYPYDDLHNELVQILEHRARCSDLSMSTHNYYDLLFAFHVYRENYRRAASTMYEQAWRLGVEQKNSAGVKRRHTCLVSSLTCLMLIDEENQWLVHPKSAQESNMKSVGARSPKRDIDGEEQTVKLDKPKIVVCELEDLRKEIILVEARLKIAEVTKDESSIDANITPQETVALLNHAGLFEVAFSISTKFDIPLTSTFQSLTTRCVQSSFVSDDSEATSWITEHDSTPHVDGRSSAADVAWRLLEDFLRRYGDSPGSYRSVLTTLLSYNYQLPAWFVNQYKKLNGPELLRMLICYDYLDKAAAITLEYIDAVLGVSPEQFNVKSTLSSIGSSVWLPYSEMEFLLHVLREDSSHSKNDELLRQLYSKMEYYFMETEKIATSKRYL